MRQFWADTLADDLSQGDLLHDAWIGTAVTPRVGLRRGATAKGGKQTWDEGEWLPKVDGIGYFLGRGRAAFAILLSHDCEIDKPGGQQPVLVAPVYPLTVIQELAIQEIVRQGQRFAFLPVPAIPGVLPESYADFRSICYLPRAGVDQSERKQSVSADGKTEIAARLIAFFTRVSLDEVVTPRQGA